MTALRLLAFAAGLIAMLTGAMLVGVQNAPPPLVQQ